MVDLSAQTRRDACRSAYQRASGRRLGHVDQCVVSRGRASGLGVAVPVGVGTVNFAGYYTTAKSENISDNTVKTYNVAATYTYPFSKRTSVYAGVGYLQIKNKLGEASRKDKSFDAAIGLAHSF